jgi:hypothetical protein
MVSFSLKATWVTLGGDQAPLLPLRGRPNIWTWVLNNLIVSTPLAGSCISSGSVVHLRSSLWLSGRISPFSGSNCLLALGRITSPSSSGYAPQQQSEKHHFWIPDWVPRNIVGCSRTGKQDTKAVQQEAMFYCASTDSCPKAESQEQKGLTLYTLASRLQKWEARFNPYMVVCSSVGHFAPGAMWSFFTFRLFTFDLLAMSFPPLCYIFRTQTCLLLFWPSSLL